MEIFKNRPVINVVKKVHRFTDETLYEPRRLFDEAGMFKQRIKRAIDKVTNACMPCVKSGLPINSNNLSLKHVNKEFILKVQADFMTVKHNNVR